MKKYTADIRDRYVNLLKLGDFSDRVFSFEEKDTPNTDFDKIEEGMHMWMQGELTDAATGKKLPYGTYEIEIVHKYADVIFYNIIGHSDISVQHMGRYSVGFAIMIYPYEIIIPKDLNVEVMSVQLKDKIKIIKK